MRKQIIHDQFIIHACVPRLRRSGFAQGGGTYFGVQARTMKIIRIPLPLDGGGSGWGWPHGTYPPTFTLLDKTDDLNYLRMKSFI
jgi:hypothetical protein